MSKKSSIINRISIENDNCFFKCPICGSAMKVTQSMSGLICFSNHNFDFSKHGYINLALNQSKSNYDKSLFNSRRKIIRESSFFNPMIEVITSAILDYFELSESKLNLIDLGAGEGSHLVNIINQIHKRSCLKTVGVGMDLSKEGILMASKAYPQNIWIVGDLAKIPIMESKFDVILNILSPSSYEEFKRILNKNGMVIKVIPGPSYLNELKTSLLGNKFFNTNGNHNSSRLFRQNFSRVKTLSLVYKKVLYHSEIADLIQMTPFVWTAKQEKFKELVGMESFEVTIDLEVIAGYK